MHCSGDNIIMYMVNPTRQTSTVFIEFTLGLRGQIAPFIDNSTIHASVDLLDTDINITNSAFPDEWSSFVGDLVHGWS